MISTAENKQQDNHPIVLFLWAITGYVVLLSLSVVLQSGVVKGLSYVAAFGLFLLMLAWCAFLPKGKNISLGFGFAIGIYFYGLVGSFLYNFDHIEWSIALKMLMAPMFILIGARFEAQLHRRYNFNKNVKALFVLLILLPIIVWMLQLVMGLISLGAVEGVSIFANRNNAALYTVTLFALYNVISGKPVKSFLLYLLVGACFGTLGVLLAILVSLSICVTRNNTYIKVGMLMILLSIGLMYMVSPDFGVFTRITTVIDSFIFIVSGRIDLAVVTYAELVNLLQTTDLSFIFRLKHWLNLLSLYSNGSIFDWVFGYGVGSSSRMADISLVPHNDYLRYLFECGFVTFVGFISIITLIIYRCGRRWESVPLVVVTFYFFSENLVNNFIAMTLFYFCSGALSYRIFNEYNKNKLEGN